MNKDTDAIINEMTESFLRWPLPESVRADLCATEQGLGRVGTNLLSHPEAKAMLTAVVLPALAASTAEADRLRGALEIIPPHRLRALAAWFDADDALKGRSGDDELQRDLRRMAELSAAALAHPNTSEKKDYTHEQARQFKSGFVMQKVGVMLSGYNEQTRQYWAEFEDGRQERVGIDELGGLIPNDLEEGQ